MKELMLTILFIAIASSVAFGEVKTNQINLGETGGVDADGTVGISRNGSDQLVLSDTDGSKLLGNLLDGSANVTIDGTLSVSSGITNIGVSDSQEGLLSLRASASLAGGSVQIFNSPAFDTETNEWLLGSSSGILTLKGSGGTIGSTNIFSVATATRNLTFNEGGADQDFRIESNTNESAFFFEGSSGDLGLGTNTPGARAGLELKRASANAQISAEVTGSGNFRAALIARTEDSNLSFGAYDDAYTDVAAYAGENALVGVGGNVVIAAPDANQDIEFYAGNNTTAKMTLNGTSGNFELTGNILVDGGNIGTTVDPDLLVLADVFLKVNGTMEIEHNIASEILILDQNNSGGSFINHESATNTDYDSPLSTAQGNGADSAPKLGSGDEGWVFQGMIKVEINGSVKWIPYYGEDDDS